MRLTILPTTTLALTALAMSAAAQEKQVKKEEVPPAVTNAVTAKYPKASMKSFTMETENGKTFYEVELKGDGAPNDVKVTPEGKIESEEKTISTKDIPEAVRTALSNSAYGKAKVKKVEKVTTLAQPGKPTFQFEVEQEGKWHELTFSDTGELKSADPMSKGTR